MNRESLARMIKDRVFTLGTKDAPVAIRGSNIYRDLPWIFDFRAITLEAMVLSYLAEEFWKKYAHAYPFQVGGMESASISLITAIVLKGQERGTPVHGFFIRKSRKRDGLMKMFEGGLTDDPVILVDDMINSGQSINKIIVSLSGVHKKVTDVFVILSFRALSAYSFAHERSIQIASLFTLEDIGMSHLNSSSTEIPHSAYDIVWKFAGTRPRFNFVVEKSAPVLDENAIYFGSDNSTLWSLDQTSGRENWHFKTGIHPKGIFSTPALQRGNVYFGAYDGSVYAIDAKTGKRKWEYADADWVGSSPALAPDLGLCYVGLEFGLIGKQGGIVALSLDSGKQVWSDRTPEFTHGSPLYIQSESLVTIGSNDNTLYAYDAATGSRRWTYRTQGEIKGSCAFDAKRKLIVFGSWDGKVYALHVSDGSLAFSYETGAAIFSTPLISDGTAYIGSLDKSVYAIDLETGLAKWTYVTNGRIFASPVIAEGMLWIGSNDGRLYELEPKTGNLKSFFQASERIVNAIAYNPQSKLFFVPTVANEIYCIKRK